MKLLKILTVFLLLQILWSCSWIENFVVVNESNQPIDITYTLSPPEKAFAIFENTPEAYGLQKSGQINWDKKLDVIDIDTNYQTVKVILEPNSTLIFGYLHNDKYTSYNQYFINGRSFNLVEMTIKTAKETIVVKPETFDTFFKKINGSITYLIS